ncbi:MAG: hypothetical protein AAFQ13_06455 [Pseudomonadota bacterium]
MDQQREPVVELGVLDDSIGLAPDRWIACDVLDRLGGKFVERT